MIALIHQFPPPPPPPFSAYYYAPSSSSPRRRSSNRVVVRSSSFMDSQNKKAAGLMEFPYLTTPHRNLMVDLVSTMETRLHSQLLPCSLPQHVRCFENQSGSSQGSIHIRPGNEDSPVDFILGSWIHSKLPSGALSITTLTGFLNTTTDAPRFVLEFIQSSPTSIVLFFDLPPRKDLVLYPDYLNTFYMDTQLEQLRQQVYKIPEAQPYFTSSLYIRSGLSPTAVSVLIDCGTAGLGRMDEIILDCVGPVAKGMLDIWLDKCACGRREMQEQERFYLEKRDALVNQKTLDFDLASGLPRLFGPDVAGRVIEGIQKYFKS